MGELRWLEGYSGQSTEELIALEGQFRTDSLACAFEEALQQKAARVGMENLSAEERVVLAVEALEREVNNGGYDQFFRNPSNEFAPIVVDALHRIGRPDAAAVTQDAINAIAMWPPLTVQAIDDAMDDDCEIRDDMLEECDERYFTSVRDLAEPLLEFIKSHRSTMRLRD